MVALSLPLLVPLRRLGVRLRPSWRFPPGVGRRAAHLAGAGIAALVAQQAAVVATMLVSNRRGGVGTLNVYSYVQAVYLLPYAVLAVPIATAAFPSLVGGRAEAGPGDSRRGDASGPATSAAVLRGSLRAVLAVGAVGAAVVWATAGPVGRFFELIDASGTAAPGTPPVAAMAAALQAFAGGLLGFAATAVLQRALYARGNPWAASVAVAVGWTVAAAAPLLSVPAGAGAATTLRHLGWASTAGMSAAALLLALLVGRAWGRAALRGAGRTLLAALVATVVGAGLGDLLAAATDPDSVAAAVLASAVVAVVAAAACGTVLLVVDPWSVRRVREWRPGPRSRTGS